mmetsp:Transcript_113093/g.200550  ORF Transcript_113093/g.200550 Transcript_113093/m.200550 type:complete len:260 (-) Transcript_113093:32-811(-)
MFHLSTPLLLTLSLGFTKTLSWDFITAGDSDEELIEKQVKSIIELQPVSKDFYIRTARKTGKVSGSGCVLGGLVGALLGTAAAGPIGGAALALKYCAGVGGLFALLAAVDSPFSHWHESVQAAYRARKSYVVSFSWLDIDAFEVVGADPEKVDGIVRRQFRQCALRYHPDKLPLQATQTHRETAAMKFANCKFAKAYILKFQKKYGVLDPEDTGAASKEFLHKFAGAWAATFGSSDGIGSLDGSQVAEWLSAIKHHAEL